MSEQTNQTEVQETAVEYDFGDVFNFGQPEAAAATTAEDKNTNATEDTDTATTEDNADANQQQAEDEGTAEQSQPEQTIEVEFLKEKKQIPLSEAVKLAQKGMNHDRLKEKYDALKSSKHFAVIDKYAKQSGLPTDQYLEFLEKQIEQQKIANLETKGYSKEAAAELLRKEQELEETQAKLQTYTQKEEQSKRWGELFAQFPELDVKKLPDDLVARMNDPANDPVIEYTKHENAQLKAQIQQLDQARKTKEKTPGSAASEAGQKEHTDNFSEGFWSYLKN